MNWESIKDVLMSKVFGVPVALLAVVGFAGMVYFLNRTGSSSETADTAVGEDTEDASGDVEYYDPPTFVANESESTEETTVTTSSNETWRQTAYAWAVGTKSFDPLMVEAGLSAYLAGEQLTAKQNEMIQAVLVQFGRPPAGPAGTSTVATFTGPATSQGTPPLTHTVKGTMDDSLAELARLYWGVGTNEAINQLRAANPTLPSTSGISTGTAVKVPAHRNPSFYRTTKEVNTLADVARAKGLSQVTVFNLNPTIARTKELPVGTKVQVR